MSLQPIVDFLITDVCQKLQIMGTVDKAIGKAIGKSTEKLQLVYYFSVSALKPSLLHVTLMRGINEEFLWIHKAKEAAGKTGTQNT